LNSLPPPKQSLLIREWRGRLEGRRRFLSGKWKLQVKRGEGSEEGEEDIGANCVKMEKRKL
jgi:hypothetical protein